MRRYWFDGPISDSSIITIQGDLFHHIFSVCRQEVGSKFELLNGTGNAFFVVVESIQKKMAQVRVLETRTIPVLPKPHLHLYISIPKFATFETILEKTVELGVHKVHPFFSDYSFVKSFSSDEWTKKSQRWNKIIASATQQTGRGDLMSLEKPFSLNNLGMGIHRWPILPCLFLYEGTATKKMNEAVNEIKKNNSSKLENLGFIIGSEGGFSFNEIKQLQNLGLSPVTLGNQVLRVETACLSVVSILKYEFNLMEVV